MPEKNTDNLVTVASYGDSMFASLAKHHLACEGIDSIVADSITNDFAWHLSAAIGGAKLQVRESDYDRAVEVLNEKQSEAREAAADRHEEPDPQDYLVDKSLKSATVGLLFMPMQIYSLWLLARACFDEKSRVPSRKAWLIILINLPVIGVLLLLLFVSVMNMGSDIPPGAESFHPIQGETIYIP
jgi:hypothetical protein